MWQIKLKGILFKQLEREREVETLSLYWFTQTKFRPVLLYKTCKGFHKQVFKYATLGYNSILKATTDTLQTSPESKSSQVFFDTKSLLTSQTIV